MHTTVVSVLARPNVRLCGWLVAMFLAVSGGCQPGAKEETGHEALSAKGQSLKLLVVDDPALAAALDRLRGEWKAQTESVFEVVQMSQAELAAAPSLPADALIGPSALLGELAETKKIVPIPQEMVQSSAATWSSVFSLIWTREAAWNGQPMAVPFGSPILVCYCRADLLKKLNLDPPRTWNEYRETARALADRASLGDAAPPEGQPWCGSMEPLASGYAAAMLLARVAAYADHPENESALFDADTMKPLIDTPPFVRALEELVAAASSGPKDALTVDPAAARQAFWEGRTGMAISWPTAAESATTGADRTPPARSKHEVTFVELPGSKEVYNFTDRVWEQRSDDESIHVPLLSFSGRLGTVSSKASSPQVAFQLLFWLFAAERSEQICPKSPATTLFRTSQVQSPERWVEPSMPPSAAAEYAKLTATVLSGSKRLFVPRIPGGQEYMAALDEAVNAAVQGKKPAADSLSAAAKHWDAITDRRGRAAQREAYWHGLGLK